MSHSLSCSCFSYLQSWDLQILRLMDLPPGVRLVLSFSDGQRLKYFMVPFRVKLLDVSSPNEMLDINRFVASELPALLELPVPDLTEDETKDISRDYMAGFRKKLDERPQNNQLGALVAKPHSRNPLWLSIALGEARVWGVYETLTTMMAGLPNETATLLGVVLARLEHDHGEDMVRSTCRSSHTTLRLPSHYLILLCVRQSLIPFRFEKP